MNLRDLQREVGEWSRRNFPGNEPWMPLLGVVEEICGEMPVAQSDEDKLDAAADAVIFLADFAGRSGLDVLAFADGIEGYQSKGAMACQAAASLTVGRMAHIYLKLQQGIRGDPIELKNDLRFHARWLLMALASYVRAVNESNLEDVVAATWANVSKRDWRKDPEKGGGA